MVAHIPGLKVVFPATPYDAKGLMNAALVGTDPVIFFESQRIYDEPEHVPGRRRPRPATTKCPSASRTSRRPART